MPCWILRTYIFPLCSLAMHGGTHAHAQTLSPGDAAPAFVVKDWIRGEPIERLDPEAAYVIEFWATWCGPCVESIPHLTECARQHADLTVIGVSVLEESKDDHLRKFVQGMGDKIGYRIAYGGNRDGMAETWLAAAAQDGLPTAFLVVGGKVLWIGHPEELADVVARQKAGTLDLAKTRSRFLASVEATKDRRAANSAMEGVLSLRARGEIEKASVALTEAVRQYPQLAEGEARLRYEWLADDDPAAFDGKSRSLAASDKASDVQMVASIALRLSKRQDRADLARTSISIVLEATRYADWDVLLYARTIYLSLQDDRDALRVTQRMLAIQAKSPAKDNAMLTEKLEASVRELEARIGGR